MEESRRSRLRQGALDWQLLHDLSEPGRYVEQVTDESWIEHLRRFDRVSAGRCAVARPAAGVPPRRGPPQVTRYVVDG